MAEPLKVVVTGAAGQIAYSLLYSVAKGDVFGYDQSLELNLLDITPMMEVLNGVVMELQDCAIPLVKKITATDDPNVAFKDVNAAFMVGAMPRKDGMERKDLLKANVKIFKAQGQAMDKVAKKTVRVVVVGNPANTNACILSRYAPSIPKENFTCLTRLDQNRAQAQIAARLGVTTDKVTNVIIWGNHSSTQFPDVAHAKVELNGQVVPVPEAVKDDNYLKNDFIKTVQQRGAAVIKARKLSSAMSAAKAACDHMHDWFVGTKGSNWVSMGVISDGSYGIKEGLMYSYPVQIKDKKWSIVQGLSINEFAREKLDATAAELDEELEAAVAECTD
ncbi:malate dehydrogenase [Biomphalaria glabrata]|uniref:Malate dehydrogenase n=1 Tax=Biomphalaria glabrata TaxID=6526 RepID=A0A2C9JIY8_BIOGL|nr:malate dehydrogenase, cytoplasmic [Biomphalaria glabrata]KAI8735049.1 malate dehydrogenase W5VJE1 Malate dehydrogenase [Biomphalaria glabrata]KAI8784308.1 malate dehydrogenase [Biomphalaria glabrata]